MVRKLKNLERIAERKFKIDKKSSWSEGSVTYLNEMRKEIDEVFEEIESDRLCYLEDELGDILWDYLNAIKNLEGEKGVSIESILNRVCKKYEERVSGLENGIPWKEVKKRQKDKLAKEYKEYSCTRHVPVEQK